MLTYLGLEHCIQLIQPI